MKARRILALSMAVTTFKQTEEVITGTFRLNQKQLYDKDIYEIAGEYTENMVFTSSIV
ncbi:hypothetical protein [Candidatus Pseudoruminococcus sp.]|uniref:hypothetical protein n=1 Tax=Candidatus Pseudoruminococcus sp. TaxID=3101048 RepID=UPI00399AE390|nr:hypothetical protein [Ruminococcus sp.]